jgi:hypothetical protein
MRPAGGGPGSLGVISEDDIDGLYRLPLGDFVSARNALAARAGERRAEIRGLEKPSAAAWGVNQLYWRRRKVFDRLTTAFEHVRGAQARLLAGHRADLSRAEAAHHLALDKAMADVRGLLVAAGDAGSAATMAAVSETLQALPFSVFNGRLSRPLAPAGFGALAGLLGGGPPTRSPAEVVSISQGRRRQRASAEEHELENERAAERRQAEIRDAEAALDAARRLSRDAAAAAARLNAEADFAVQHRDHLRADLESAEADLHRRRGEATRASEAFRAAQAAEEQVEGELKRLNAAFSNSSKRR